MPSTTLSTILAKLGIANTNQAIQLSTEEMLRLTADELAVLGLHNQAAAISGRGTHVTQAALVERFNLGTLTRTQRQPRQQAAAGLGNVLPVTFGRDWVAGQIFVDPVGYQDKLLVALYVGKGPITGYVEEYLNGEAIADVISRGVQITRYTGAAGQGVDPWLADAIAGFADSYPGLSYVVLWIPQGVIDGFPRYEAKIDGLALYDPREGGHVLGDPGTWAFSKNPALALAYVAENYTDWDVDYTDITALANYCDTTVNGLPRRTIGLTLDRSLAVNDLVDTLMTYAGAFRAWEDGKVRFIPEKAETVSVSFDSDEIQSIELETVPNDELPTVVEVRYIDDATGREASETAHAPGVLLGTIRWKETVVTLAGIHNAGEAARMAVEMLNYYFYDLRGTITVFDEGLQVQLGSVIDITHPIGLTAKQVRVNALSVSGADWMIGFREYDPAQFSDEVASNPTYPDTSLPNPLNPPALGSISVVERLFTDQAGRTFSRLEISWTGSAFAFTESYRVTVTEATLALEADIVHRGQVSHSAVTGPVKQGISYHTEVAIISTTGQIGAAATNDTIAQGKLLKPLDVPSITGFEAGQYVSLKWERANDIDLIGYQIRRGTTSDAWEASEIIVERIDALYALLESQPSGTWRYYIKSLDSLFDGTEGKGMSVNATFTDIEVTAEAGANVLQNTALAANAVLTNMSLHRIYGVANFIVTDFGEFANVQYGDVLPNTTPDVLPCLDHPDSSAAYLETDEWDIGLDRTGNWKFEPTIELLDTGTGVAARTNSVLLATTAAYPTFTTYAGNSTVKPGRYMKSKIEDSGNNGDAAIRVKFPIQQSLIGKIITQKGTANIPSSGQPLTVIFPEPYATTPDITLTLISTSPRIIAVDSITTTQMDIYAWDAAGVPAAATGEWISTGT